MTLLSCEREDVFKYAEVTYLLDLGINLFMYFTYECVSTILAVLDTAANGSVKVLLF